MAPSGNSRSIAAMLIAVGAFSFMDAALKVLSGAYPPLQVAAMRGLSALPLVCVYVLWRRELHLLVRVRWPLHLLRGVISILMLSLFAFAIRQLALVQAYTIFFVAPLLITVLSIPLLKERVLPRHWAAIAVGMVGVVIALRPQGDGMLSLGALAVLVAAACYALSAVLGRILCRTDAAVSLVFWSMAMLSVGAGLLALPQWVPLAPEHWPVAAGMAVTGFVGQFAITEAFRHGQASAVAPFEYTALAWAIVLDWLFWNTAPDGYSLAGGAVVIASGLYLMRKEKVRTVTLAP